MSPTVPPTSQTVGCVTNLSRSQLEEWIRYFPPKHFFSFSCLLFVSHSLCEGQSCHHNWHKKTRMTPPLSQNSSFGGSTSTTLNLANSVSPSKKNHAKLSKNLKLNFHSRLWKPQSCCMTTRYYFCYGDDDVWPKRPVTVLRYAPSDSILSSSDDRSCDTEAPASSPWGASVWWLKPWYACVQLGIVLLSQPVPGAGWSRPQVINAAAAATTTALKPPMSPQGGWTFRGSESHRRRWMTRCYF